MSLSAVLAVALLTALAVWQAYADNARRRTQEAARQVADVADALRTTDLRTALLLGAAAWRVAELPESRRALLGSSVKVSVSGWARGARADAARVRAAARRRRP